MGCAGCRKERKARMTRGLFWGLPNHHLYLRRNGGRQICCPNRCGTTAGTKWIGVIIDTGAGGAPADSNSGNNTTVGWDAPSITVTANTAFKAVMAGCAAPQEGRDDTWINKRIRDLYLGLFERGHCHSVEVWRGGDLVGGLYGVSLGRAFFGESMFHTERDASKVALVGLVERLRLASGPVLLDTQWRTEHLATLGVVDMPRRRYLRALAGVVDAPTAL